MASTEKFAIHDISSVESSDLEQLGTKQKFWFFYHAENSSKWLFKYSRENTGEHWSEKIAEQICQLLGIPHVRYELATLNGSLGVISENAIDSECRMIMGNEVLYPNILCNEERRIEKKHTVARVLEFLESENVRVPVGDFGLKNQDAASVFCGYLMLDALIGNQDRHHENWAVIANDNDQIRVLCPSYDHAASLGRELTDETRHRRLNTRDSGYQVRSFVTRARSALFAESTDEKSLTTLDAFLVATERKSQVRQFWLARLKVLELVNFESILDRIDETMMSDVAKNFALQMLLENRDRLLKVDNG